MADAVQKGTVSATKLVMLHLDRIEAVNPRVNCVVTLAAERALSEAQIIDVQISRGIDLGPLAGVPITIKDSFDTAGVVSSYGMASRAQAIPDKDATAVARLRGAGAIVLGKTNTSELTVIDAAHTDNLLFGCTNNPYDLTRSPSGSSGGPAAAVASGCSALDIGSDTGGSIRDPAHVCGIVGLKPTAGRIARTGHCVSFGMGALDSLTHVGPMARTVDDVALALAVLSGPNGVDPLALPNESRSGAPFEMSQARIAFYVDDCSWPSSAETTNAIRNAAYALRDAGAIVTELDSKPTRRASDLFESLTNFDGACWKRHLANHAKDSANLPGDGRFFPLASQDLDLRLLCDELAAFRADCVEAFSAYDAILGPISPTPARLNDNTSRPYAFWNELNAHNLSGFPAVSVPAALTAEGLPIGVQVVSTPWNDNIVLEVARAIECRLGGFVKPLL
jgi:amidase